MEAARNMSMENGTLIEWYWHIFVEVPGEKKIYHKYYRFDLNKFKMD